MAQDPLRALDLFMVVEVDPLDLILVGPQSLLPLSLRLGFGLTRVDDLMPNQPGPGRRVRGRRGPCTRGRRRRELMLPLRFSWLAKPLEAGKVIGSTLLSK